MGILVCINWKRDSALNCASNLNSLCPKAIRISSSANGPEEVFVESLSPCRIPLCWNLAPTHFEPISLLNQIKFCISSAGPGCVAQWRGCSNPGAQWRGPVWQMEVHVIAALLNSIGRSG